MKQLGSYTKFTDVDLFQIGQYAGENGNKKALIHFQNKFPGLKESTVKSLKKQHQEELKKARSQKQSPSKVIKAMKRGRPLLLGGLDKMTQFFLKNTRSHGGVVNIISCTVSYLYLGKKYIPPHGLCQTCWGDRKS